MNEGRQDERRAVKSAQVLLCLLVLSAGPAAARDLTIEVRPRPTAGCRVALRFAPGMQGLAAARRPEVLELAALVLLGERTGLRADWDGLWLSLVGEGSCRPLIAETIALWRRAADLEAPSKVVAPALSPPQTEALRRDASLQRAVAAALGGSETAVSDLTLLELTVDALADAPARLTIEGTVGPAERALLPSSATIAPSRAVEPAKLEARPRMLPPVDGTTRFWVAWQLEADAPGTTLDVSASRAAATLTTLLGHRGHRVYERLVSDMGLVHTLDVYWLEGPSLLVVAGSLPGPGYGAALDRLFIELGALEKSLTSTDEARAVAGAQALSAVGGRDSDARSLAEAMAELTRERAAIVIEPARDDLESQVTLIDAGLIAAWTAATLDLRCPAPDERRDRNRLLWEAHGLDARRYLAISRALGRDAERMRQLDRELVDRCAEDKKLRALLPGPKIVALHRDLRCGRTDDTRAPTPDDPAELARRRAIFARYRVDSSVHRPLIAMAKRSPELNKALLAIEERCPDEAR